ncbi:unnamed protein product [Porites lobata]|uniref:Uncharacterized protein n=1 Tax=Porites lobata TaxID=104759 RepID=A0ABN8Q2U8_9CNID|nr:unnamed protein product [Porites lobata]
MAGQGLLYVRIDRGYEFFYAHSNHGLETSYLEKPGENNNHTINIVISTNWNILEKEKDREKEKIGDSQAKINEKKSDGELEQEIRSHF